MDCHSYRPVSPGKLDESQIPRYVGTPPQKFINNAFDQQPEQSCMTDTNESYNYGGMEEYSHTGLWTEYQIPRSQNEPVPTDVRFIQGTIPVIMLNTTHTSNFTPPTQNSQSQPTARSEPNVHMIASTTAQCICGGSCCVPHSSFFQESSVLPNPINQSTTASINDTALAINLTLVINYPADGRPFTPFDGLEGTTYEATQPSYLSENVCFCRSSPAPKPGPIGSEPFQESCATSAPDRPISSTLIVHRATQSTSCESCKLCSNETVPLNVKPEIQLTHITQLDETENSIKQDLLMNAELTSDSTDRFLPLRNFGVLNVTQAINLAESSITLTTIIEQRLLTIGTSDLKCDESLVFTSETELKPTMTITSTTEPRFEIEIQMSTSAKAPEEQFTTTALNVSIEENSNEEPTYVDIMTSQSTPTLCACAGQPNTSQEVLVSDTIQLEVEVLRRYVSNTPEPLPPDGVSLCQTTCPGSQEIMVSVAPICQPRQPDISVTTNITTTRHPISSSKLSKLQPKAQEASRFGILRRFSRSCVRSFGSDGELSQRTRRRASSNPSIHSHSSSKPICFGGQHSTEKNKIDAKDNVKQSEASISSAREREPCLQRIKSRLSQAKSKCHTIGKKLRKRQTKKPRESSYVLESIADKLSKEESSSRTQSVSPTTVEGNRDSSICVPYLCIGRSSETRTLPTSSESREAGGITSAINIGQPPKPVRPNKPGTPLGEKQVSQSGEAPRRRRRCPLQRKSYSLSECSSQRVSLTFKGEELSREPSSGPEYSGKTTPKSMRDSVNTWGSSVTQNFVARKASAANSDGESTTGKIVTQCGAFSRRKVLSLKSDTQKSHTPAELQPISSPGMEIACANICLCQGTTDLQTSTKKCPLSRMPVKCRMKSKNGISPDFESPKPVVPCSNQITVQVPNEENARQIKENFDLNPDGVIISSNLDGKQQLNLDLSTSSPGITEQIEKTPGHVVLVTNFSVPEQNQLIHSDGKTKVEPQLASKRQYPYDFTVHSTSSRMEICSRTGKSFSVQIKTRSDPVFHAATVADSKDVVANLLQSSAQPLPGASCDSVVSPNLDISTKSGKSSCSSPAGESVRIGKSSTPIRPSEECAQVSQQMEFTWGSVFLQTNMDARFQSEPTYVNEYSLKKREERVNKFTVSEVPVVQKSGMSDRVDTAHRDTLQPETNQKQPDNEMIQYQCTCRRPKSVSATDDLFMGDVKCCCLHSPMVVQNARPESEITSAGNPVRGHNIGLITTDYFVHQYPPGSCMPRSSRTFAPQISPSSWAYIPPVIGNISPARSCACNPYCTGSRYAHTLTSLPGPLNRITVQFTENLLLRPVMMPPAVPMHRGLGPCRCMQRTTLSQSSGCPCSAARQMNTRPQSCSPALPDKQLYEAQNVCMYTHSSPPVELEDQPVQVQVGKCRKSCPKSLSISKDSEKVNFESCHNTINDSHATNGEEVRTVVRSLVPRLNHGMPKESSGPTRKRPRGTVRTGLIRWKLSGDPSTNDGQNTYSSTSVIAGYQSVHTRQQLAANYSTLSIFTCLICSEDETEILLNRAPVSLVSMIHWYADSSLTALKQISHVPNHCNTIHGNPTSKSVLGKTFTHSSTQTVITCLLSNEQQSDQSVDTKICTISNPIIMHLQCMTVPPSQLALNQGVPDTRNQLNETANDTNVATRHTPPIHTFMESNADVCGLNVSQIVSVDSDDISRQASPSISLDLTSSSHSTTQWCQCDRSSCTICEKSREFNSAYSKVINRLVVTGANLETENKLGKKKIKVTLFDGVQMISPCEIPSDYIEGKPGRLQKSITSQTDFFTVIEDVKDDGSSVPRAFYPSVYRLIPKVSGYSSDVSVMHSPLDTEDHEREFLHGPDEVRYTILVKTDQIFASVPENVTQRISLDKSIVLQRADVQNIRKSANQAQEIFTRSRKESVSCKYVNQTINRSPAPVYLVHKERNSKPNYTHNKQSKPKPHSDLIEANTGVLSTKHQPLIQSVGSLSRPVLRPTTKASVSSSHEERACTKVCDCCLCTRTAWLDAKNTSEHSRSTVSRRRAFTDETWVPRCRMLSSTMPIHVQTPWRRMTHSILKGSSLRLQHISQNSPAFDASGTINREKSSTVPRAGVDSLMNQTHQLDSNHHLVTPGRDCSVTGKQSIRTNPKIDRAKRKTYPPFRF